MVSKENERRIFELCEEKGWVDAVTALMVAGEIGEEKVIAILEAQPKAFRTTSAYKAYLGSEHWAEVRAWAVKWAGSRCMVCNASDPLQVHHRTYERLGHESRTDVLALCERCHKKAHDLD